MKYPLFYINRPEYIFQPCQVLIRLLRKYKSYEIDEPKAFQSIKLPWSIKINIPVIPKDVVSKAIASYGLYDISLTESIWRLSEAGDTSIDVGSHIGYMSSVMWRRVGYTGKVFCFEPNPEVYLELCNNVKAWQSCQGENNIKCINAALSSKSGHNNLIIVSENRGESFINNDENPRNIKAYKQCLVKLETLDDLFSHQQNIGVLKVDVEGHELEVFKGGKSLLYNHRIRDILFEDHYGYPSAVSDFLEQQGYTVFRIWKGFWKPLLLNPKLKKFHPWEPPNYLATCNPTRAEKLFSYSGWHCLFKSK